MKEGGQGFRQKKGGGNNNKSDSEKKVIFMAGVDLGLGGRNFGQ